MTVVVFASESASSRSRLSRDYYRFAEHVERPHPYSSLDYHRDDQAWVCLRENAAGLSSLVTPFSNVTLPPIFLVSRPTAMNAEMLAAEVLAVRAHTDNCWRKRARHFVALAFSETAPARLRFEAVLVLSGVALPVSEYCADLPARARRIRQTTARGDRRINVPMKEVLDWTFYLRVAAGRGIGVTLTQRVIELGGSLRTFRRVCRRLRQWIPQPPRIVTPQMVIDALVRRLSPPPQPPNRDEHRSRHRPLRHAPRLMPQRFQLAP